MARIKRGVTTHARRKKIILLAKGYRGRSKNCYSIAIERVEKALRYAYRDRRNRKRQFRALWIQRINAGVREHGLTYSQFINGINKANIEVDRKSLAELAVNNKDAFKAIVDKARQAI
jgi:large subunit ribosomal protein L20